jgi:hypothetical protein
MRQQSQNIMLYSLHLREGEALTRLLFNTDIKSNAKVGWSDGRVEKAA